MWLIMAHSEDYSARWLAHGLRGKGLAPLVWISASTLGQADTWEHRIGDGQVLTRIRLTDGRAIDSLSVRGIINRIHQVPADHMQRVATSDRSYAFQEMAAFYLSWLAGFDGSVFNPASPNGLGGRIYHSLELFALARASGLAVPAITLDTRSCVDDGWQAFGLIEKGLLANPQVSLIVVKDHLIADPRQGRHPSADLARRCLELSRRMGLPLLGLQFIVPPQGPWVLAAANPLPDLTIGGQALIDAFFAVLTNQTQKEVKP